jgi:hypothetical protein
VGVDIRKPRFDESRADQLVLYRPALAGVHR